MALTTSSLLRNLGAVADPCAIQDDHAALRLRVGPHSVHGGEYLSRWFNPTYRISAVISTGRSISLVESEMPAELKSEEEGLAWLAAILGGALPNESKPAWLLKGERLSHLLCSQMSKLGRGAINLFCPMSEEQGEAVTGFCGGIPKPFLFGTEEPSERLALQNICVEKGRPPSCAERLRIRQSLGN